jgi:hypothetical protein
MAKAAEVHTISYDAETYAFWLGLRFIEQQDDITYPITANSVAHLADPEGVCRLESRQRASQMLEKLVEIGFVAPAAKVEIGGDFLPSYTTKVDG